MALPYHIMPRLQALLHDFQLFQNTATRIVTQDRNSCSITPILKDLHWLQVEARIEFKTLLQVYKYGNGIARSICLLYFSCTPVPDMEYSQQNTLRLNVPSSRLQKFGDRAFSVAGPRVWNELPYLVRESSSVVSFKRTSKTHLFNCVYLS